MKSRTLKSEDQDPVPKKYKQAMTGLQALKPSS